VLTFEQIERLPPEPLAIELLRRLPEHQLFKRASTVAGLLRDAGPKAPELVTTASYDDDVLAARPTATIALMEAWQQLILNGLIVDWPARDPAYPGPTQGDVFQLTRWGREVRRHGDRGRSALVARRRLGVDLHSQLAAKVREVIAVGAFEQAALIGLRAIEARVRKLTGDPRNTKGDRLTGPALMQAAFRPDGGPLADPTAEPSERVGTMNLFAGAFGAVRNALVHTEVEWSDSVEAAEYVLLADLLMRLLDRAEQHLPGSPTPSSGS
jgi:uncharacterized protein (TIGR02391 family)